MIPAVDRIRLFDPGAWEDFIREWADALRGRYVAVDRFGGAGDMGCDVVATASDGDWDNFQCKHYDHPLWPSDAWTELGKIVYYTWRGDLSAPRTYYFVAPQGVGTTLSNLLRQPARLREHLLANWDTHCRAKITDKVPVELEAELRAHIERFDFSIFRPLSIHRVLDEHARTRWHASRFGGGLPPRPLPEPAPQNVQPGEAHYVRALLDAYSHHLRRRVQTVADLAGEPGLDGHFTGARHEFYSAEALRLYARETLPPQTFEDLQRLSRRYSTSTSRCSATSPSRSPLNSPPDNAGHYAASTDWLSPDPPIAARRGEAGCGGAVGGRGGAWPAIEGSLRRAGTPRERVFG